MKQHLQVNGSYKLTTALLGAVVVLAVLTGTFARTLTAQGSEATNQAASSETAEAPTEATYTDDLPATCDTGAEACAFQNGSIALLTQGGDVTVNADTGSAQVTGDVTIPTNGVAVELLNSDLDIEVDEDGEIVSISGTADVPLPTEGPLAAAVIVDGARAAVGYDWGRNLAHLGAHVQPDRQYFYFTFEDSFSMQTGFDTLFGDVAGLPVGLSAPGDVSVTMVLDPLDPFLYIGGACPDFGSKSDKTKSNDAGSERAELSYGKDAGEACGLGVSLGGNIPFEAQVDSGASTELQTFSGHIVIDHSDIPVATGVMLDGELVIRIGEDALAFGGNGDIRASVPLVEDILDFSFPLATASTGMRVGLTGGGESIDLFMSGSIDSQTAFDQLPEWLPLESPVDAQIEAAARLKLNFNGEHFIDPASFVELKGHIAMVPSYLSDLAGVDLSELLVTEAQVRIDKTGVRMQGKTSSSLHPAIGFNGEIAVDGFISPADPLSSYVALDGQLTVAALDLNGSASLRLDSNGFSATGSLTTPVSEIEVSGLITTTEVSLAGRARVEVPLNLLGDLLDGAPAALADAKEEVGKLDTEIQRIRDEVNANRETRTRDFAAAQTAVDTAKADVDGIQGDIDAAYRRIATLNTEIAEWEAWYNGLPDVSLIEESKATAWIGLAAEVGWRGTEIGLLYTGIAGMETARGVAQLVLDGAKLVLAGVEAGLDVIPVDADPRIVALLVARDVALGALTLAEGAVSVLTLDAKVVAEIEVYVGTAGVSGTVSGQVCSGDECLEIIGGTVTFGANPEACFTIAGIEACLEF